MIARQPRSTRTDTLFPYTTLFRSVVAGNTAGDRAYPGPDHRRLAAVADQGAQARADRCARARADGCLAARTHPLHVGASGHYGNSRSEEHTSELQSLMRISYAVFCLKKKSKTLKCNKISTSD